MLSRCCQMISLYARFIFNMMQVQGLVMHMGKASQLGDDLLRELYKSIE